MLLYTMLCIVLAYLMLFAALTNADCLYDTSSFFTIDFANAFCFHALSLFIDTKFVYFKYYSAPCTVLLIRWFFLILCSHRFFNDRAMCSLEK